MGRLRLVVRWSLCAAMASSLGLVGCVQPLDLVSVVQSRVTDAAATPAPAIKVSSGGTEIPSGGTKTMPAAVASSTSSEVSFQIDNPGTGDLKLTGTPVIALTGANADEFSVPSSPATTIAAGSSSLFTVRFTPISEGTKSATVTIANNSSSTSSFSIALTATATPTPVAELTVSQTTTISNGSTFTYPATIRTQFVDRVFTITNNGSGELAVTSLQVAGTGFSLQQAPASTVAAGGGTTTFTVRFSPTAATTYSGSVTIGSNDPTYSSFDFSFNLSGTGTEWHGIATVASANDIGRYNSVGVNGSYVYIAYADSTNGDLKVVRSTNGALTWSTTYTPESANGIQNTSMVIVGSDVYVAYCSAPSLALYPKVVKGTGGTSWGSPVTVSSGGGIDISLSYADGTFYLVYATPTAAHVDKSTNGTSWTTYTDFDSYSRGSAGYVAGAAGGSGNFFAASYYSNNLYCDNNNFYNDPYPWINGTADAASSDVGKYVAAAAGTSGNVLLAYYDVTFGNLKYVKGTRTYNLGSYIMSFSSPVAVDARNDVGLYPSIATPDGGNTIYISHYDSTNGDLRLSKSTNGGVNWTSSTVDGAKNTVGQYSSVAVDGTTVYISYYDGTNGNLKIAKSLDGGATW